MNNRKVNKILLIKKLKHQVLKKNKQKCKVQIKTAMCSFRLKIYKI